MKSKTASLNMTEGSILRNLIWFAVPVLIGNIFQQLYNVADTAIIGNILGDTALAAVGAAAPVYGLMIGFAGGLTNGFAVVIARFFGAGDERGMKRSVALTYLLSAGIAFVLTVASLIALQPLMASLKTPPEIIGDTEKYMRVIMLFSAVTIAYNMFAGMMRALGNSKTPLYFLIVSTFVNIGLDFLFVGAFKMGVAGAAYATVISQGVSVALCIWYVVKKCRVLLFSRRELTLDKPLLSDLATTGMSMGLMYAIVSVGSVILQGAVNSFGTSTITAHTAARKIDDIFMLPLGTIALASSTFASQNFGAGKMDRVKKGIKYSIFIALGWSAFSVIVAVLFRRPMIRALTGTSDPAVIATASKYIVWNISFFFVLSFLLVLRSSLQGVGRKLVPVTGSAVEFALKIVAAAVFAPKLGYFGICISEPVIWIACAAIVIADYMLFTRRIKRRELPHLERAAV
ncbi:MATE family efflux transporter [Ruminococcus sp. 210702-SL.1.03]|uniref:MATE family efflux transporter n=1 Tax=Ruminococcus sp. 210702-SL.1.03 TaxID=2883233 RepID=UPI001D07E111|nr:MATE family efflux transporter [Ruminococcus sp. 210702-SL.1.03]MCB6615702.1 MATE family efflux transporter [Ruminococcus sp. 210702-SL.1.03]